MKVLLVLLLMVGVALIVAAALRRARQAQRDREARERPSPPRSDPFATDAVRPDPRALKVGDIVGFEGRDYVVRGSLRMDQSGLTWQEHLLDDTRRRLWLSVEDDEGLELCVWERVPGSRLEPGPASLGYDGREFLLEERGEASFRSEGTTGAAPAGRMEYVDYAAGDDRLAFERFGAASWEVSRGRVVSEGELTIYPVTA